MNEARQAMAGKPRPDAAAPTMRVVASAPQPAPAGPAAPAPLESLLAGLEARVRMAQGLPELAFSIANESYGLLKFRQALVLRGDDARMKLMAVSGLARPSEDSPYLVWLRRAWTWLLPQIQARPGWFVPAADTAIPEEVAQGWREWWTRGVLAVPLRARSGRTLAWVVFLLEAEPAPWQLQAVERLAGTWGYCWEMLGGAPDKSWRARGKAWARPLRLALLALAVSTFFIPISQTVLAPAEVISLKARVVAAPLDGVVRTIHVRPNQAVKAGDLLFSLDDTTLRNRYEVARESVAVADAELVAASQRVFQDASSQNEIALLTGRAHERRAELEAVRAELSRVQVVADEDGVAVFGDPDDWLGRPVSTGERIMLLADPGDPGMLIHLPVADAMALEPGAQVKLFLTVKPLEPLSGTLTETSYQAGPSPDGIASYRLRAVFDEADAGQARIGLHGTAKLYGEQVTLAYYLFRRPLAAVREWTGW
ncbi:efflux RND transporter periplasmic adaptor subunit [Thauera sp. Sel9]|uniref:efflux RND transporter periplasmic adaptor subunit n=1 Tax=Thauera sp. Sel9 TaxID=2974299 RepID=UPI0021E12D48|nr:biotin/lipoyl-binding protein [Thauera sp. Sel9]MCV2216906.1 biotin/lipoyl-binding protein [Thauera sp. Sel9]